MSSEIRSANPPAEGLSAPSLEGENPREDNERRGKLDREAIYATCLEALRASGVERWCRVLRVRDGRVVAGRRADRSIDSRWTHGSDVGPVPIGVGGTSQVSPRLERMAARRANARGRIGATDRDDPPWRSTFRPRSRGSGSC